MGELVESLKQSLDDMQKYLEKQDQRLGALLFENKLCELLSKENNEQIRAAVLLYVNKASVLVANEIGYEAAKKERESKNKNERESL